MIITAKDFKASQSRYIGAAKGKDFANDFRLALTQLMETMGGTRKAKPVEELIDELRSTDN